MQRIIKDSKRRCHRFDAEPPAVFKEFCLISKERNILMFTDYPGPAWACFLAKTLLPSENRLNVPRPLQHTHIQLTQLAHTHPPPPPHPTPTVLTCASSPLCLGALPQMLPNNYASCYCWKCGPDAKVPNPRPSHC